MALDLNLVALAILTIPTIISSFTNLVVSIKNRKKIDDIHEATNGDKLKLDTALTAVKVISEAVRTAEEVKRVAAQTALDLKDKP